MSVERLIKLDAKEKQLPLAAPKWAAVLDHETKLIWDLSHSTKRMNYTAAVAWAEKRKICGELARAPERIELLTIVDHSRTEPAIDIRFFPKCPSSWFWSKTVLASSPSGCAWCVGFGDGSSYYYGQHAQCFVRAVRSSQ
jgi:hypothetical protein